MRLRDLLLYPFTAFAVFALDLLYGGLLRTAGEVLGVYTPERPNR
jgi:hypothetical protein